MDDVLSNKDPDRGQDRYLVSSRKKISPTNRMSFVNCPHLDFYPLEIQTIFHRTCAFEIHQSREILSVTFCYCHMLKYVNEPYCVMCWCTDRRRSWNSYFDVKEPLYVSVTKEKTHNESLNFTAVFCFFWVTFILVKFYLSFLNRFNLPFSWCNF